MNCCISSQCSLPAQHQVAHRPSERLAGEHTEALNSQRAEYLPGDNHSENVFLSDTVFLILTLGGKKQKCSNSTHAVAA